MVEVLLAIIVVIDVFINIKLSWQLIELKCKLQSIDRETHE